MAAAHFSDEELISQLANANTQFALDLYKKVANTADNIFLSPISISAALAMTRLGARGNTESEMDQVMKWTKFGDKVHDAFEDYLKVLNAAEVSYTLTMANRIFVYNKLKLLDEFVTKTGKHYKADAVVADFVGKPLEEKKRINEWVEKQTNGKIKDVISDIDPLTRLILINAIYFKGTWKQQFDPRDTVKGTFKMLSGKTTKVDMMILMKSFLMERNDGLKCQVLELPYLQEDISMFILLPFEADGLTFLEEKLKSDTLNNALRLKRRGLIDITLPKFVLESDFALQNVLPSLGMVDAFDVKTADFSGMTGSADLYISQVIHKTFLEVNEEGSEAAAATAVILQMRSMPITQPFVADHPFLFVIRDNRADMILFIGKLGKP
ncbi:leukocyte elastase inhibitor-like [Gigantopelta aegis]|uniref:leukocyte elastase inhibitor-like n=1 Tax=Gigantopelta aegis TaxID=1735272 RepID=UPI001B88D143|nr:leukocyte elastase inhibitor-like [Gigantopelta aegis]